MTQALHHSPAQRQQGRLLANGALLAWLMSLMTSRLSRFARYQDDWAKR